jgi:photosystem II stability/assembly factor-like uncharacterized protein
MKLLFVILFTFIISTIATAQWERTNGPEGISIRSLANIDNVLYAGTKTDGIYASRNEGSTWFAVNNGIETKSISVITSINDTLLAGTSGYGVIHSTDRGQTWLPSSNYSGATVVSMIVKDQYVFAGTSQGVLRSSDDGITWEQLPFYNFETARAMCSTGNKLIAAGSSLQSFASTDNGNNWYVIESLAAEVFSLYARGDTVYAGARNKIYRSVDGGNTFFGIEIPFDYSLVNINSITSIGQTLFMGTTYDDGVYKSTNYGLTWESVNEGMGPKDVRALVVTQSSYLIAGSHYAGVYRSTDNGESWNKSVSGFPAGSSILSMFNADRGVLAGTRDGIYKTTNNGTTWVKLTGESDTINYGEVRGISSSGLVIYAAITYKYHGIVYKSTDFGDTWTRSGNGFSPDITFMSGIAISGNNIIAGSSQGIYYSTDEGDSWLLSNLSSGFAQEIVTTPGNLYAEVQIEGIYRSSDNGVTWIPSFNPPGIIFTGITALDNSAYASAFDLGIYFTTDNGNSWYPAGFPTGSSGYTVKFIPAVAGMVLAGTDIDPNFIYVSFNNSHVFSPYSEGLGVNAIADALTSNDLYTFAGTSYNGVWRRLLPGVTPVELTSFTASVTENNVTLNWKTSTEINNSGFEIQRKKSDKEWKNIGFQEGHGSTTDESHYSFVDKNISSGHYNYRLKQIDFDGSYKYSDIVDINISGSTEFSLEQNYPNPFNPTTTIKYSIAKAGKVSLRVFNILGEEVVNLVNEFKEAGNYKVNFNAGRLSSGIYYYRLSAGNYSSVKKMILLK